MKKMPLTLALLVLCLAGQSPAADFDAHQIEFFENQIRPLLAKHCFECHSRKAKRLEAGLYLDSRAGVLRGGDSGAAIVPGDPEESLLISAVNYDSFEMPPKGKLKPAEVALLSKWVKMGAPWPKESESPPPLASHDIDWRKRKQEHWSWQPIAEVAPPAVKHQSWPRNPVDQFVLSRLEEKGLLPAAAADRRTLIRRLYFDLIGLPPSREDVREFVADQSPEAYENLVDRLLENKHFGEKWARHWMDLVRYAETHGHEFDYPIHHAYRYRDYLIRAFNADVPYNQFVTEHIAGDLLQNPRRHPVEGYNESVIGTGFWFLGEAVHAPTDVRGDEAIRIDNQINVFSKAFLGLTVGCTRCHDHKFDPIPTEDYYALTGFLQSSRRQEAMLDPHQRIRQAADKIRELRRQADQRLVSSVEGSKLDGGRFAKYLLAAAEAIRQGRSAAANSGDASLADLVFDDFERDNYDGWTVTGDAFGDAPATGTFPGQQPVSGFAGGRLVNSWKGSDSHQGTMTSREFPIKHDFINLLVGGGFHEGTTCVNLLVDGKVVRTAVGKGNTDREKLSPRSWDVREFRGRTAKIEIVDRATGGWGHINVDQIVFSQRATASTDDRPLPPDPQVIASVAEARGLDAAKLKRWSEALLDPALGEITHPMHVWAKLMDATAENFPAQRDRLLRELAAANQRAASAENETELFEDFHDGLAGWFTTGQAFDGTATSGKHWDGSSRREQFARPGVAHSGLTSPRLHGVLRSPTFELKHPSIHYRLKAKDVQIRLIIDGYFMDVFNGLLFRDVTKNNVNTQGEYRWITQSGDLRNHLGRTAHIEIIDHGDGFAAVDEIRFSAGGPPPVAPHPVALSLLDRDDISSVENLAASYGKAWESAADRWQRESATAAETEWINWITNHRLQVDQEATTVDDLAESIEAVEATIPQPVRVLAMTDGSGEDDRVHIRGSHQNVGEVVPRRMLLAISGEQQPVIEDGSGRLELAKRVTDPSNPFVSRVLVNRLWHHLFGRGIVPSVDDFGLMGQPPTHPQLLDWLAADFVQNGWSVKHAIRRIVTSNTYRMSSKPGEPRIGSPDSPLVAGSSLATSNRAEAVDPTNELFHRMPIRRLPAEAIRDAILTVSGRLDETMFGPSVPVHLTSFMEGRGRPRSGPLDGNGRRSVYIEIRRNFLSPMMLAFDMPSPFSTMGRRSVSNVPAQSLILMNDPFVVEQAKRWAERVLAAEQNTPARIAAMFESAFARPPSDSQLAAIEAFIHQQAELYQTDANDPRVWTDVCHIVFNMKEFIYLN